MLNLLVISHHPINSRSGVLQSVKLAFFDSKLAGDLDTKFHFFHTSKIISLLYKMPTLDSKNFVLLYNGSFSLCSFRVCLLILIGRIIGCQQIVYWHETAVALRRLMGYSDVGWLTRIKRCLIAFFFKLLMKNSQIYHLVVSKQSKQLTMFLLGVDPINIFVIYEAIDFTQYTRCQNSAASFSLKVCGAGLLDYRKGFDIFVSISQEFFEWEQKKIVYSWFGGTLKDVEPRIRCNIASMLKETHIQLPGFKVPLRNELKQQNIFLLTSRDDPFPIVALEALACDLAVFCFDSTGIAEILPQEFVCNDKIDMIEKIKLFLEARSNYQPGYFQEIAKRFDKSVFLQRWQSFVKLCLKR
jgi:glycosyltransferase involved in cell wall biosynthesis